MNQNCHLDIKNYKLKIFRKTSYIFPNNKQQFRYSEYLKEQKFPGLASGRTETRVCEIVLPKFEKD
jgi:hypothetical protein